MVDTVQSLRARGHRGTIDVISRRGLLPRAHHAGGVWPLPAHRPKSPIEALRTIRSAIEDAQAQGIPWQRVFDAFRPIAASVWSGWSIGQRAQFLRHLRTLWDIHRHRMAEPVAAIIRNLLENGTLRVRKGRLLALDEHKNGVTAIVRPAGACAIPLEVAAIINCTGPDWDLRETPDPLLKQMVAKALIQPDPLGLGLESEDCALRKADGTPSAWLFALGALTRPALWEITAVPEINTQIGRLVDRLTSDATVSDERHLSEMFVDMGEGI